ncbi:conjugative transposon TraM protein [Dyadobacter jejuensis]|uniref:Conjugative transposon TraM protein n=1 Tax=Dyadobacter jejuensis TaxID=1082580 RepID=A0A316A7I1_9BACT|nr:conjugative transposon protein TraM [Dyadobacter jejuensis]PWJ53409.1 conjugative transposon TraM protein [Dyadobacter jejuensis]
MSTNETNDFSNQSDIDIDINSKKRKQGQMLLIILVAMILVVVGIVFFTNSIGKEKDTANDLENIMPLEAKNKKDKNDDKYGKNYDRKVSDENYQSGIDNLTDDDKIFKKKSNENLTDADFAEVRQAGKSGIIQPATSKSSLNRVNQNRIAQAKKQIAYDANPSTPIFTKSEEELREERLAQLERENNTRLAESIISGLEKANSSQPLTTARPNINISHPNHKKQAPNGLIPNTNTNTIGRSTSTGFYSESKSLEAETMNQYSYIPAVVHGNGDGVKVQNGSNIKLRLLAETYINVGGMKMVMPRNSLLNGIIRISNDRLNIIINSVRIDNNVIPVSMLAYDIDGSQGLYIPNLVDKNLLARELAEAGARPLQGSYWNQGGSIGNQIGTQMATQTAQTLLQGTSQYLRRKMNTVRVTIKPNYKVLLTTGSLENTNDAQTINNY